jgi:hypothetical protein
VIVLATLQDLVWLIENERSLDDLIRAKVRATITTKRPFVSVEGEL